MPASKSKPKAKPKAKAVKRKPAGSKGPRTTVASATMFIQVAVRNAAKVAATIHADARDHARHAGHPTPNDVTAWFKAQLGGTSTHAKELRKSHHLRRVQVRPALAAEIKQMTAEKHDDVLAICVDVDCSTAASASEAKQRAELLASMDVVCTGTGSGRVEEAFAWPEMTASMTAGGPWFPIGRVVGLGGWKTRTVAVTAPSSAAAAKKKKKTST